VGSPAPSSREEASPYPIRESRASVDHQRGLSLTRYARSPLRVGSGTPEGSRQAIPQLVDASKCSHYLDASRSPKRLPDLPGHDRIPLWSLIPHSTIANSKYCAGSTTAARRADGLTSPTRPPHWPFSHVDWSAYRSAAASGARRSCPPVSPTSPMVSTRLDIDPRRLCRPV